MDVGGAHDFIWVGGDLVFEITSKASDSVAVHCWLLQIGVALGMPLNRFKEVCVFNVRKTLAKLFVVGTVGHSDVEYFERLHRVMATLLVIVVTDDLTFVFRVRVIPALMHFCGVPFKRRFFHYCQIAGRRRIFH